MCRWMNRDRLVGRQMSQVMPRAERKEAKQAGGVEALPETASSGAGAGTSTCDLEKKPQ